MRTRTLAQRRAQDQARGARRSSRSGTSSVQRSRTTTNQIATSRPLPMADEEELTAEEAQAAFEMPYDNQQPRSQMSLARAATVAAVSPANRRHLRALPFRPLEYSRADGSGQREVPHESDADNWVPPPPAYTAKAEEAESVSLSHPSSPPSGSRANRNSVPRSAIPPVPPLPTMSATINPSQLSPTGPYQNRGQSFSSTDLSLRRPSLIHPTTYPSPHSSDSIRRRGSAARSPPQQLPYVPPPQSHPTPQSPPSPTFPIRRPSMFSRRAVETISTIPPPTTTPDLTRRGSAPLVALTSVQRRPLPSIYRPLPPNPPLNPTSTPVPRQPSSPPAHDQSMRNLLPRLVPPVQYTPVQHGYGAPASAPPRTDAYLAAQNEMQSRIRMQGDALAAQSAAPVLAGGMGTRTGESVVRGKGKEKEDGRGRKKIGCAVM